MKRILGLLFAALILSAGSAHALITAVGSPVSAVGNATFTVGTAGDMLIATVRAVNTGTDGTVVTDNSGANVWHRAASCSNGAIDDDEVWYTPAAVGGTYTITAGKAADRPLTVSEWAGATGNPTETGVCGAGTATTTVTGGLFTGVNNTDLVISDWASATASSTQSGRTCANTCTGVPSTWNQIAAATGIPSGESAYIISTTAGTLTYQITTTTAVTYAAVEVAFAAAPAATPSPTVTATAVNTRTPTPAATSTPNPTASTTPTAAATAIGTLINLQGYAGLAAVAPACSGGTGYAVIRGRKNRVTWSILPEGGDIRCETGTSDNGGPLVTPSATVGMLFKSNVMVTEATLDLGSSGATLQLNCCGVSGSVNVSTWEEGPAPTAAPTPTLTPTAVPT